MAEQNPMTALWIKVKHRVLCFVVGARRREMERCLVRFRRANEAHERAHRPLRILESENMWLINGVTND